MDQLKEIFNKLPESLQHIILAKKWQDKTVEIAGRYNLNEEQQKDLALQTLFVLVGLTSIQELKSQVAQALETTEEKAEKLADAITQKVLAPIEAHVKKQERETPLIQTALSPETPAPRKPTYPNPIPEKKYASTPTTAASSTPSAQIKMRPYGGEDEEDENSEEEMARLDRLQILDEIENPVPVKPQMPPVRPVVPTPQPEPLPAKPIESTPDPKPAQAEQKKNKPNDGIDLLSTIQEAQVRHGAYIVDQKLGNTQTSRPDSVEQPRVSAPTANRGSDPYREPI